jgi:tetratricopeptide (TPR) repeat protein
VTVSRHQHRVTRKTALRAAFCGLLLTLQSCAWLAGPKEDFIGSTLEDLQPARMPDLAATVPSLSLEEIEEAYHRALEVAENEEVRRVILVRLAGLEMVRSEQNQLDAEDTGQYFTNAIDMYRELVELQAGRPGRDKLLYQLAKAYALDGRTEESAATLDRLAFEYPNSPYIAEAQFRRAERAFSDGNYQDAEAYYRSVVQADEESQFYDNAIYMHGWSQFKNNRYEESLVSFTEVLDRTLQGASSLEELEGPRRNLAEDTLTVMSLVFSYLDSAQTIRETYREQERSYNHLLYQSLGDLYLEKKRYRDSADTYQYYVDNFPNSDYSPQFSSSIIAVYDVGDFPSQLLPAKEDFINNYGIRSQFWAQKPEAIRETLRPDLHTYLDELAKFEHSQAQALRNPEGKDLKPEDIAKMQTESTLRYEKAARWYGEFVETFPDDEQTPNMVFLLGESYYESNQLAKAVTAYERVAFEYYDPENGAKAGYAAILALGQLADTALEEDKSLWRDHLTESSITFSDYYPGDENAPKVLAQAAQSLLNKGDNVRAIDAAQRLTVWQPPLGTDLLRTAWLIVGQAQFDLALYPESEYAYRQVLALMPEGQVNDGEGPSRQQVVDRISASMFKQAEASLASADKATAVNQLLDIAAVSPGTEIAAKAQYDAGTYLMDLERWGEAEQVLTNFRASYPNDVLTATLPAKLVVIYQSLELWDKASRELGVMAQNDNDPEVRRQSLYLSAELAEQAGNTPSAIEAYRQYANTYTEPLAQYVEASYKMVELYGKEGDISKRRFWLEQLVNADINAGPDRTDRTRYLAAMASSEMAEDVYAEFSGIRLTLPLKRSLDQKRAALDRTLKTYERILDYGVAEYTTLASYRIGSVYAQLSRDLMDSERPKDLDALALEQYTVLLEEQAFPFEEKAIEVYEANVQRSWSGVYDDWVKESFNALAKLLPARYQKDEEVVPYTDAIH